MTEWAHVLGSAWKSLCDAYERGDFAPATEADIQSELYHLVKRRVSANQRRRIHVCTRYSNGSRRTDLQLGSSYYVETKKRKSRDWGTDPSWFNDVKKLQRIAKQDPRRTPVAAVLFITPLTGYQLSRLEEFRNRAWEKGVRLIFGSKGRCTFWR